ncbi:rhomboid family intramembrane serine protease [Tropicimonas sp. TH_r6]|uniref:rhomboid family intramembrane serine protease n=1 Tax=Tropicimonas sp. TH_r6 TaxID=3082085 RepID=UPI00295316C0|nr:rhomboid family intramembrane serine protease [Tropicimonas sp. TH_r6]MDV7145556.1 rhomboid family intramembrane serine protease [Tropicimonas sp. TH_r6]
MHYRQPPVIDLRMKQATTPQTRLSSGETAVLWTILIVCVLIEGAFQLSKLDVIGLPGLRIWAYGNGAFWPVLLQHGHPNYPLQPWLMFLTYGFIHGGLLHMCFNMITLWSLGTAVTSRVGIRRFLVIYFTTMIAGAATYGALVTSGQPMVGSSGALFGLAGTLVAWIWLAQPTPTQSFQRTWRILAVLLGLNVLMYWAFSGQLAWETHLGGFVAGWALGIFFEGRPE